MVAAWPMTELTRLNYGLLYGFFYSFVCPTATHLPLLWQRDRALNRPLFSLFVCLSLERFLCIT